jgi:6-phosphogluconolactonase (cycloisomerase 2 family)
MTSARASLIAASAALALVATPTAAADLIVSANDAKFVRVAGQATYPANPPPDTLTVLDASSFPPVVVATVEVHHTLVGPPQAVAITPDGTLAVVSAPDRYDYAAKQQIPETFLQVVDLEAVPPRVTARVELGRHPQGLAISPDGTMLLATTTDGHVAVLAIDGKRVALDEQIKLGDKRLSGISFTHDGRAALVALRDEQGLAVLGVDDGEVTATGERVTTGVAPYAIDVSGDGRWAVVGNVGLGGLAGDVGKLVGDADSITLIDVARRPFRAVQHLTVPSIPEGVALSPDGRWIAVQAMDGSNLPEGNPGRHDRGKVMLFEVRDGEAVKVAEAPSGEAAQGIVFTADGRYVLVQMNVERAIAVYAVNDGQLEDTGERIALTGGPASIRSMPR